jgi:N-acetylated-alpha-linked acidic dipeptidase
MNFGFGGTAGTYHSAYDTFAWMSRFGDPGFVFHAGTARLAALVLARLGDASLLPHDPGAIGMRAGAEVEVLAAAARDAGHPLEAAAALRAAFDSLAVEGRRWATRRDSLRGAGTVLEPAKAAAANRLVREAERQFVRPEGLAGHPWGRNLLLDSDRARGYATLVLPGLAGAVADRDWGRAEAESADLARRARRAAALVREAGGAVTAPGLPSEPR